MAHLFTPLKIRGISFRNRVVVSPMCQYSAVDGVVGTWHQVHLGAFATGGSALVMVEATGVNSVGRISIGCPGLWNDEQEAAFVPIVKFAHSQGTLIGIQLAHAGRKASTTLPGSDHAIATPAEGGWQSVAPSPIAFHGLQHPHELSVEEIKQTTSDFVAAATRAVRAGFDVVEIHAAHGYLLHQFLSPISNHRTDEYGGSLANRTRFLREVSTAIRGAIPDTMPLFVRISATDWSEGGWDLEQSIALAQELKLIGVDLIDVSTGGTLHDAKIPVAPGFQVPFARAIKEATGILTAAVGMITEAEQANSIVESDSADLVMLAREMLRNPRWTLDAATKLAASAEWPIQLIRGKKS
jgi:2,4-dienoyl-CoA reductase-like NADH-dependent reductase (Old Yellow Enzyme family)